MVKKYTKKQLALIRRVLKMKGLPKNLRHMLLMLLGATLKPSKSKHKKSKSHKKGKKHSSKSKKGKRVSFVIKSGKNKGKRISFIAH